MKDEIDMSYDAERQQAVLTFPGGKQIKISGVSVEKAEEFRARHAGEFQKRDCCLTTSGVIQTREASHG